mmetsp:Transcript_88498/g.245851  ORF Transcript_88498/g.245851 Transcript_88498/m.245851 type:complete len:215 (-) Transcript_88498:298-942(-)
MQQWSRSTALARGSRYPSGMGPQPPRPVAWRPRPFAAPPALPAQRSCGGRAHPAPRPGLRPRRGAAGVPRSAPAIGPSPASWPRAVRSRGSPGHCATCPGPRRWPASSLQRPPQPVLRAARRPAAGPAAPPPPQAALGGPAPASAPAKISCCSRPPGLPCACQLASSLRSPAGQPAWRVACGRRARTCSSDPAASMSRPCVLQCRPWRWAQRKS